MTITFISTYVELIASKRSILTLAHNKELVCEEKKNFPASCAVKYVAMVKTKEAVFVTTLLSRHINRR